MTGILQPDSKGYTFIELTIVIILICIMLTLTIPGFRHAAISDQLKVATRGMIHLIKEIRSEAMREQKTLMLNFDKESNRFWVCSSGMTESEREQKREKARSLPEGIRIIDIRFKGKDAFTAGETSIAFDKKGYTRPALISLGSEDGRELTLELSPFLGRIKILEGHAWLADE